MTKKIFFTPGPSELYPTVPIHIASALENKIGAISHRSKQFQDIFKNTTDQLRTLLQLPSDYHILFLGSASEVWERIIQNCAEKTSFHCVNGSFSKRFYEFSGELGRKAFKEEALFGKGFDADKISVPAEAEIICLTHNETSSGVSMPEKDIHKFRDKNKNALIFIDSVSSLPYPAFDYSKIDSTFFSVQKCFGLPAGLGVWIVNDKCVGKANTLLAKGVSIGTYHTLPSLLSKAKVNQTPETPNVFSIYLLGKIAEEMNKKGVNNIRKETEQKAEAIYSYLEKSSTFSVFVKEKEHRSKTTIIADCKIPSPEVNKKLEPFDMAVGTGYGNYKEKQIRIANFPTHSVEQVDKLIQQLKKEFN
ncbi:MAG: aminotransferase class V-fold PLP-dependent enzyme [Cytophagaceae bacterium]|nr:aminotransferase class V-fold PLP-dependent enzyme [Cytophagaceae bacterium]